MIERKTYIRYKGAVICSERTYKNNNRELVKNAVNILKQTKSFSHSCNQFAPTQDNKRHLTACVKSSFRRLRKDLKANVYSQGSELRITVQYPEVSVQIKDLMYKTFGEKLTRTSEIIYPNTDSNLKSGLAEILRRINRRRQRLADARRYQRESRVYERPINHSSSLGHNLTLRGIEVTTKFHGAYPYNKSVYTIHDKPGRILDLYNRIKAVQVFSNKRPMSAERHVGIEIEFACKADENQLATALNQANLGKYVTLKKDGSLSGFSSRYITHELVVCAALSEYKSVLRQVLSVINSNGATVNSTCGLHVHLDMRNDDYVKAFNNLVTAQNILYKMIPQSRRNNRFCKPTRNKQYSTYRHSSDRYQGINPCAMRRHNTLEVRLHSGTTDYSKITNFVDILCAVAYNQNKVVRAASTVTGFAKQHKLNSHYVGYINTRIQQFAGAAEENS